MNCIDYEDELAETFCSVASSEYDWEMEYGYRPENPMTKNILRREIFDLQAFNCQNSTVASRKRTIQMSGSPAKTGSKTSRKTTFQSESQDDLNICFEQNRQQQATSFGYPHRVVSDDSESDRSSFSF